tara:strand:- start:583 stop:1002 length:420 start_codon:yes stop_codon:yes gene_type:complete
MIYISKNIYINESTIKFKGIRSSKPGGQNVNKVSSGIHLQYDLKIHKYPEWFMNNINQFGKKNISNENILNIKSISYRTQHKNKKDAVRRMVELFQKSVKREKKRINTKTPFKAHQKRILDKKKRSRKKILRKSPLLND